MAPHAPPSLPPAQRRFLESGAAGGLMLVARAPRGLPVASAALLPLSRDRVWAIVGGLGFKAWIDDAPMAAFFLPIGRTIKRAVPRGRLHGRPARLLPGAAWRRVVGVRGSPAPAGGSGP